MVQIKNVKKNELRNGSVGPELIEPGVIGLVLVIPNHSVRPEPGCDFGNLMEMARSGWARIARQNDMERISCKELAINPCKELAIKNWR